MFAFRVGRTFFKVKANMCTESSAPEPLISKESLTLRIEIIQINISNPNLKSRNPPHDWEKYRVTVSAVVKVRNSGGTDGRNTFGNGNGRLLLG